MTCRHSINGPSFGFVGWVCMIDLTKTDITFYSEVVFYQTWWQWKSNSIIYLLIDHGHLIKFSTKSYDHFMLTLQNIPLNRLLIFTQGQQVHLQIIVVNHDYYQRAGKWGLDRRTHTTDHSLTYGPQVCSSFDTSSNFLG